MTDSRNRKEPGQGSEPKGEAHARGSERFTPLARADTPPGPGYHQKILSLLTAIRREPPLP